MNQRQARQLIAALSSAVLDIALLRRRMSLFQRVPEFVEERIVLPMGDFMREMGSRYEGTRTTEGRMLRKVGRNRKISVGGKLYGPLDQGLVGQQVEVEERDGRIVVWSGGTEAGSFEQQG